VQVCPAPHTSVQVGAPLQFSVQSPSSQLVMLHDCAPVQVRVQSPCAQSIAQFPLVHVSTQLPSGQLDTHDVVPVQLCMQSPCGHTVEHDELVAHV